MLVTEWEVLPPEHAPKLAAEPVVTTLHCTEASPLVASPAEKFHVCVVLGPKVCPSGPLVMVSVGGVLSMVTLDWADELLPAASNAVALMFAAPSEVVVVLNEVAYGAVVSVPTRTSRTRNSTRETTPELSLALALKVIVPRCTPELGLRPEMFGAVWSLTVKLQVLAWSPAVPGSWSRALPAASFAPVVTVAV